MPSPTPRRRLASAVCGALTLAGLSVPLAHEAAALPVSTNIRNDYTPASTTFPAANGDLVASLAAPTGVKPITVGPKNWDGSYTNFANALDFHLVMYRSTDAKNRPIWVTGTLIRSARNPAGFPAGTIRPLVAYAPGNQGMSDHCASSVVLRNGSWYENSPVNGILGKGFDVVVPDYEAMGLYDPRIPAGQPQQVHPVANNRSNGQVTLDALRAGQKALVSLGRSAPEVMAVWGYSEGGGAAAWAASHLTYAHDEVESKIKGVAAGGVTADLYEIGMVVDGNDRPSRDATDINGADLRYANGTDRDFDIPQQQIDVYAGQAANPYAALLLMALGSFEEVYKPLAPGETATTPYDHSQFALEPKLTSDTTSTVATHNGLGWVKQVKDKCLVDGLAVASGLHVPNFVRGNDGSTALPYDATTWSATANNPLVNTVWLERFRQNNPAWDGARPGNKATPTVPTYLYHGSKDISVAYTQTVELRERWCAQGADVYWKRLTNSEHVAAWGAWATPLNWVQQVLINAKGVTPNGIANGSYATNCAVDPSLT